MSPSRIHVVLSLSQRRTINHYKAVYGLSISKIGKLALMEFFANHPLAPDPQTFQLEDTPAFASVDALLQYLEEKKTDQA
ncbi:hypothetical protein [Lacticaseibacillus sp. GG6-2]